MSINPGLAIYKLAFQLSPIILQGGVATNISGGMLPIIAVTEALNFPLGLLSGTENIELDDFFANFLPLPGASIADNQIGTYPFANQSVAANALIAQPLTISMLMVVPVRNDFGYAAKLGIMTALQAVLANHNQAGGTYTIVTPSYFYTNCIMVGMRDVSNGASHQAQNAWQMDFVQPLLTLEAAQQAQNSLLSKITNGTQVQGQNGALSWSGVSSNAGITNPAVTPAYIPSSASSLSSGVAAPVIPVQATPLPPP